jgi:hypothetical protein
MGPMHATYGTIKKLHNPANSKSSCMQRLLGFLLIRFFQVESARNALGHHVPNYLPGDFLLGSRCPSMPGTRVHLHSLERLGSIRCPCLINMASRASVRGSDGGSWNSNLGSDRNGRSRRVGRASAQSRSGPTLEWGCCGQLCRRVRSNVGRVCLLLIYLERVDEPVGVCESCRIIADEICARVGAVGVCDLWTGGISIRASRQIPAEVGVDDDVVVYEVCVDVAGGVGVRHKVRGRNLEDVDCWAEFIRVGLALVDTGGD